MPNQNQVQEQNPEAPKKAKIRTFSGFRYLITFSICLIASFIYAVIAGIFTSYDAIIAKFGWEDATDLLVRLHILTDATFVSGVVVFGIGILVIATNGGVFEMLVYGVRRFISLFQRDINKVRFKTFYDYHVYRSGEPKHSFAYLLIVGGFFIAISGVLLAVYMTNR